MDRLTTVLGLLGFALFGMAVCVATWYWSSDPAKQVAQQARAETVEAEEWLKRDRLAEQHPRTLELDAQQHVATMARDRVLYYPRHAVGVFWTLFPIMLTACLMIVLTRWGWTRGGLIYADERGLLPVERSQIRELSSVAVGLLEAHHAAKQERARVAIETAGRQVPEHYAPHITTTYAPHYKNELPKPTEPVITMERVPAFRDLLLQGQIGQGQPLLLGFGEDSQPVIGSWTDLFSTAIAGATGSGKTTTTRFLACQSALHGARFVVLDPHGEAGDESLAGTLQPLSSAFLCDPALEEKSMLHAVAIVTRELDQRLRGKDGQPLVMLVDEFTALMARGQLAGPLARLIEKIAQEGRKKQVYCMLLGQLWKGDRTGGTEVRDSLASAYVHRIKRAQARFLLPSDEAAKAEQLPTGAAMLYRTNGEIVTVRIPNTTAADVAFVAGQLSPFRPPSAPLPSPLPRHRRTSRAEGAAEGRAEGAMEGGPEGAFSPEDAMVVQMLKEGTGIHEIITSLWQVSGGRRYQVRADQVRSLNTKLVRGEL